MWDDFRATDAYKRQQYVHRANREEKKLIEARANAARALELHTATLSISATMELSSFFALYVARCDVGSEGDLYDYPGWLSDIPYRCIDCRPTIRPQQSESAFFDDVENTLLRYVTSKMPADAIAQHMGNIILGKTGDHIIRRLSCITVPDELINAPQSRLNEANLMEEWGKKYPAGIPVVIDYRIYLQSYFYAFEHARDALAQFYRQTWDNPPVKYRGCSCFMCNPGRYWEVQDNRHRRRHMKRRLQAAARLHCYGGIDDFDEGCDSRWGKIW